VSVVVASEVVAQDHPLSDERADQANPEPVATPPRAATASGTAASDAAQWVIGKAASSSGKSGARGGGGNGAKNKAPRPSWLRPDPRLPPP
jgi:hypothetical protein